MKTKKIVKSLELDGRKITFETGKLAPRADAAILASMGETVVLATVTVSKEDSDRDYFPLSVEYIEKFYAGGVISGSRFVKRERFPSEQAILKARMIDRSMRPLFPDGFRREVQVVITVLSYDDKNDPVIVGINAASAAMSISSVPFDGPVAAVKVGMIDDKLVLNPGNGELAESKMDYMLSGKDGKLMMIDAGSQEVSEENVGDAFDFAVKHFKTINDFQKDFIEQIKPKKIKFEKKKISEDLKNKVEKDYNEEIDKIIYEFARDERDKAKTKMIEELVDDFEGEHSKSEISDLVDKEMKKRVRKGIVEDSKRPSGRKLDEIREIAIELGVLPRTHGSVVFSRGITQVLSVVTIGSTRLEQKLESYEGEETKRYMHHYNGQKFSLGEAGRYSYYPGRREIGHGALAEKALNPMIPSEKDFPYTIRVVSEVLAQNGSSSMASVCGSTLALMDAGVPVKRPVAGVAIGLVTSEDGKSYKLFTDMQDVEDFYGDMDFKVAGTKEGITAIQMDNKRDGIKVSVLKEALKQSKIGRERILEKMENAIEKPRKTLSKYAPKIETLQIKQDKIGDLIGPQGKTIKGIVEETGADIDIKDDGTVHVASSDSEQFEKALGMINNITEEAEVGKVYEGVVDKIQPYGAFVDVSPSISGLVHVSEIADEYVSDPSKHLKEGQRVKVKVIGIDDEGRVNLSIKRVKEQKQKKEKK